jgi:hypothetical protein
VVGALTTRPATRDSREGQSPGTAARRAGPLLMAVGYNDGKNGRWVLPSGNAPDTLREGKAPKGESQKRSRCETKPTRG